MLTHQVDRYSAPTVTGTEVIPQGSECELEYTVTPRASTIDTGLYNHITDMYMPIRAVAETLDGILSEVHNLVDYARMLSADMSDVAYAARTMNDSNKTNTI